MSMIIRNTAAYIKNLKANILSSGFNGILTQSDDLLITEGGDYIVWV